MSSDALGSTESKAGSAHIIGLVMALFFAFGFCTVLVDSALCYVWIGSYAAFVWRQTRFERATGPSLDEGFTIQL